MTVRILPSAVRGMLVGASPVVKSATQMVRKISSYQISQYQCTGSQLKNAAVIMFSDASRIETLSRSNVGELNLGRNSVTIELLRSVNHGFRLEKKKHLGMETQGSIRSIRSKQSPEIKIVCEFRTKNDKSVQRFTNDVPEDPAVPADIEQGSEVNSLEVKENRVTIEVDSHEEDTPESTEDSIDKLDVECHEKDGLEVWSNIRDQLI